MKSRWAISAGVLLLSAALILQLALSVRGESQTWDEGDHIFAGYMMWTRADFGLNPEHPPLAKLLATVPLLGDSLRVPQLQNRYFKTEAFLDGRDFVFGNDFDSILFRTRMAASILTLALVLLVFFAAREMFGVGAGFIAMALVVFEPNVLANGAVVATDVGLSCFMFASVYAFYRYVKSPSVIRLVVTGVAAGLALSVKHTGLFVFPILLLLAFCEWLGETRRAREAVRLATALVAVGLIAVALLWAFYGFRYQARPDGLALNPPLAGLAGELKPREAAAVTTVAHWRALPESYLYGLVDVRQIEDNSRSYVLGKVYPRGVWFYFPVAFAVKSTLAFLALFAMAIFAMATRRFSCRREILFLTIPPAFHLLVSMSSGLNIGVRHILPLFVFFSVLIAGASWALIRRDRLWAVSVFGLLLIHVLSSVRSYPTYLAYSNELWGGPSNTYKYLTDANTDWGQQLKSAKKYLDAHGVKQCWFAFFAQTVVEPSAYGIPCKPLPVISSIWLGEDTPVPPTIDGPVLISHGTLSGYETGPGPLNPYDQFRRLQPDAVIDNGIFVFNGQFDVPLASALPHVYRTSRLMSQKQPEQALSEAQAAVALAPNEVRCQAALGEALRAVGRTDEARAVFQRALMLAQTIEPEFQVEWVDRLQRRLK